MTNERIKVLLIESRLPEVAISKHFKESLLESNSEVEVEALIEKRKQLVENVRKEFREKYSYPVDDGKPTDEEFIRFAESF